MGEKQTHPAGVLSQPEESERLGHLAEEVEQIRVPIPEGAEALGVTVAREVAESDLLQGRSVVNKGRCVEGHKYEPLWGRPWRWL